MNNDELRAKLAAVTAGDMAAFEEIYSQLKTPMFTIILRVTQDKSLSEDILQEVFVKLYQSPPLDAKNPRAYIFQMARNLAVDGARAQPRFEGSDSLESLESLAYVSDHDLKMDIETALQSLPSQECQIVSLHVNGGLKFREIAPMLDLPLGTAIWKYHKAIGRLRSQLSGGAI